MIETVDAGAVAQVVALVVVPDPLDVVEVLDDEPERVLHPNGRPDGPRCASRIATHLAASVGVIERGGIEIFWRPHPEREPRARRRGTLAQDQAVVDELFVAA